MKKYFLLSAVVCFSLIGCQKDDPALSAEAIDCIVSVSGIFEIANPGEDCIYNSLFLYNDTFWHTCECCVCDKAYTVTNCEGTSGQEIPGFSFEDFNEKAEFLVHFK